MYRLVLLILIFIIFSCGEKKTHLKDYGKIPNFTLKDSNNQNFEFYQLKKPIILYFGYTHCPDYCPMTLSKLQKLYKNLNTEEKPEIILITVDPERDTVDVLKKYLDNWKLPLIGLTGTKTQIEQVAKLFGVYIRVEKMKDHTHVEHTTSTFLIDENHKLRYIFSFRDPVEKYNEVLKEYYRNK